MHIENIWCQNDVKFNKTIKDETEYRKFKSIEIEADSSIPVWGILEGIPAIGSILSFVSVIWCQIAKMVITRQLKAIIKEPNEGSEDQKTLYAVKILEKATAYTQYQNKQNGSALGLIPLLKPIARVTQLVCLLKRAGVEHQDSNNF